MIAVFINPGPHARISPSRRRRSGATATTNRPTEYNTLDDKYARVIVDELMPALDKDYNISKDPERHGIGGASSGAIAAFTVAWERPDRVPQGPQHRRQLREPARRPRLPRHRAARARRSRSGSSCRTAATTTAASAAAATTTRRRDWFLQNVRLMKALTEKGYDVNYTWGIGTARPEAGRRDPAGDDALALARSPGVDRRQRRGRALVQYGRHEEDRRTVGIRLSNRETGAEGDGGSGEDSQTEKRSERRRNGEDERARAVRSAAACVRTTDANTRGASGARVCCLRTGHGDRRRVRVRAG